MRQLIVLFIPIILVACGGSDNELSQSEIADSWAKNEVVYSYPYAGEDNLSLDTPVVLRFSEPLPEDFDESQIELVCEEGACDGEDNTWEQVDYVENQQGILLKPETQLAGNSEYCVRSGNSEGANFPEDGICFHTELAYAHGNSLDEQGVSDELTVTKTFPDLSGDKEPIMDFSTFRLQFNEPLASSNITYGEQVALRNADDELVDATLLAKGNAITVDPVDPLTAGEEHSLVFSNLHSAKGEHEEYEETFTFTPQDSEPRTILVQDTVAASDAGDAPCLLDNQPTESVLTGKPLNCVPLESVLLGDKDATMQQGNVLAELAYLSNYPDVSPIRVPRGSLLTGTNIDVQVAGILPAANDGTMSTGDVSVTFVSDATGYISANPYSDDPSAPKQVRLFMDVAMTTENEKPNAALSQDLLHVELNGMASLDGKSMEIDAVGIVEPEILGSEVAYGLLSFQMKSYPQDEQKQQVADRVEEAVTPYALSTYPDVESGEEAPHFYPNDAFVVNFNAPLDPSTIELNDTLFVIEDGQELSADEVQWYLDGASVVVKKEGGFASGATYDVELTDEIKGMPVPAIEEDVSLEDSSHRFYFLPESHKRAQGNSIEPFMHSFAMAEYSADELKYAGNIEDDDEKPGVFNYPVLLTAYPGYPCAMEWDLDGDSASGHCIGDEGENNERLEFAAQLLPANRPLKLTFSQAINEVPEGAFRVETEDGDTVAGEISQTDHQVIFTPEKPWQEDQRYKYTLRTEENGNCDEIVCGRNDKPLMTAPLAVDIDDESEAFPDAEVYFVGAKKTKNVLQALRNTPTLDTAAALTYYPELNEKAEPLVDAGEAIPNSTELVVDGVDDKSLGSAITDAEMGCEAGVDECPAESYIHLVGNLDTEIFGEAEYSCPYLDDDGNEKDYCEGPVQGDKALFVGIYPTALMAGSADVFAKALILGWMPAPTGAQVMRMHPGGELAEQPEELSIASNPLYADNPNDLIPGWIRESEDGPVFETQVRLYLDAPYLDVPLNGEHNQRNYPLTLDLRGGVEFLEDGRLRIHQLNINEEIVDVKLSKILATLKGQITLSIPEQGAYIMYESVPVKQ